MKKVTVVLVLMCCGISVQAQVWGCGFSPSDGEAIRAPIGTAITVQTTANVGINGRGNVDGASFSISGPTWAKIDPPGFYAGRGETSINVTITLESDTPACYTYFPWIFMHEDGNNAIGAAYALSITFYDPKVIGHAEPHTLNFGNVGVEDSNWLMYGVYVDTFAVYRAFHHSQVHSPFYLPDSLPMAYPCSSTNKELARASFHPKMSGHYIDTIYLFDPLTNDSIPLILIGDAFDAGVSEEAVQPLKLYPNPCDRTLTLELPEAEPASIEIRNLLGETVYASRVMNEASIDCSRLADGIYMASITSGYSRVVRKVVVAH